MAWILLRTTHGPDKVRGCFVEAVDLRQPPKSGCQEASTAATGGDREDQPFAADVFIPLHEYTCTKGETTRKRVAGLVEIPAKLVQFPDRVAGAGDAFPTGERT